MKTMKYAYGVFGLMANIVGKYGLDIMLPFLKTIGACYLTCFLFTVFVQGGLMVGLYGGISPWRPSAFSPALIVS